MKLRDWMLSAFATAGLCLASSAFAETESHEMNVASADGELTVDWPGAPASGLWGVSSTTYAGFTMTSLVNGVEAASLSFANNDSLTLGVGGPGQFGFTRTINTNGDSSLVEGIRIDLPPLNGSVGPNWDMEFLGLTGMRFGSMTGGASLNNAISISGFVADPEAAFLVGGGDISYDEGTGTLLIQNPTALDGTLAFLNPDATASVSGVSLTLTNLTAKQNGHGYGLVQWVYDTALDASVFEFSEEPGDATVWDGTEVTFSSEVASGGTTTPAFQWEESINDGASWSAIPGAESVSYTIPAAAVSMDWNQYRVVVTRGGQTLTSEPALLRVGDGDPIEPEGVVAHFRFEEGTPGGVATGALDSSGSGNDFTAALGSPTYASNVPGRGVPASGAANGQSIDFMSVADEASIDGVDGAGLSLVEFESFTIETYLNHQDLVGFQTFIGRDDPNDEATGPRSLFYFQNRGNTNNISVRAWMRSGAEARIDSGFVPDLGQWYHMAVVGDAEAGTMTLYIDGQEVGSVGNFTGLYHPAAPTAWSLGRGHHGGNNVDWFAGMMDEVRFSTTALSPVEFLNFPAAVLSFHTDPQDIAAGPRDDVTFTSLAGGGGDNALSYQWEYSDDGGETWTELAGATSASHTLSSIGLSDAGQYRAVASRGGVAAASAAATLDVSPYPAPVVSDLNPGPLVFPGDDFTYSVEATGMGNLSYQWQKDGADLDGETNAALELTDLAFEDAGDYSVVVSDDAAIGEGAEPATVTVPSVLTVAPHLQRAISFKFVGASSISAANFSNHLGLIHPDEEAGAVPVANWNHSAEVTGVSVQTTPVALVDDAGDLTGATVTWSANNTWSARVTTGPVHEKDANQRLFHGYIEERAAVGDPDGMATVTIEGIPYDTYDVYVYPLNGNGAPGAFTRLVTLEDESGERGLYMRSLTGDPTPVEIPFYLSHATTEEEAVAGLATSYLRFDGASGSTVVLRHFDAVGANAGGFAAFSIVDTSGELPARPGIVEGPSDRFLLAGGNVELSVLAESFNEDGSLSYQWMKNGVALPGEEGSTLSRNNVTSSDTGKYEVVVTDNSTLGQSTKTVAASVVVVDDVGPVLLNVDMNLGGHAPMSGHGMLRMTGLEPFQMAGSVTDNPMGIGEGDTFWNGLPAFSENSTYTSIRDAAGLMLPGVTFAVSGAAGADDVPADSGGIEEPVEDWSGPLLRDYIFTENNDEMTLTVGGLTGFRGRELTLVAYALGPQSTSWDSGERDDVSTVTLADDNYTTGSNPVATDQWDGRDLRFNQFAFAAFDAVVDVNGTISWTVGPVAGIDGFNAFNGFQILLTDGGEPPETTPVEDWRLTHFGTTLNEGDAANSADFDGDGFKNLMEYALGTDPTVAGEGLSAVTLGASGDFLTLTFDHVGDPSVSYEIEAADELDGEWIVVETYSFASEGTQVYQDDLPLSGGNRGFLRLTVTE